MMNITPYHARYFANEISCRRTDENRLSQSLFDAKVDLNPHQIDAALFALKNPLQEGVLLADEVGLGKTIEAGLVICQMWAERKRKLLIVCPAILRKQWANELAEKFNLPTLVVDKAVVMAEMRQKSGSKLLHFCKNHLEQQVMIVSHQYATKEMATFKQFDWDLVVIDEAHKMRNAYKIDNKMGKAMRQAFGGKRKLLLTATPLQNSLMELYGLSTLLDEHLFGDKKFFQKEFVRKGNLSELKSRMAKFIKRTLRKNVLEYVRYTERKTITQEFMPSNAEQELYEAISDFLHKETIYALPKQHKHLTALILRKLLASSPQAVLGTLRAILDRLLSLKNTGELSSELAVVDELLADESVNDEDLDADEETPETGDTLNLNALDKEIREIEGFIRLAESLVGDSKLNALLKALQTGFGEMAKLGAAQKAIIFTESVRTQHYLYDFLLKNGYADQVVMFSGTNNDAQSTQIYHDWLVRNAGTEKVTGSVDVDKRSSLIAYFSENAQIMIATEAASEGVNLQFCSLLINYDLPWNPQRVEQRIGRCHRYGQKFDVVVVNFLNKRNLADQRVLELLTEKFKLFQGVLGASDEVLGQIESGVDRLDLGTFKFTKKDLTKLNQETIERSRDREALKKRWNESLPLLEDMEVSNEVGVDKTFLPTVLLTDARKILTYAQAIALTELIVYIILDFANGPSQLLYPVFILSLIVLNIVWLRYFLYKSPYKRLELFAEAVRKALLASGHLQTQNGKARVVRGDKNSIQTATYLKGGTLREKEIFAQALSEFFAPIENQRYILRATTWVNDQTKYFAVPSMFDKRKEDVIAFVANIEKYIGSYEIIYTRNVEGRHILLDARLNALGNKQERTFSKKKVTSKLK